MADDNNLFTTVNELYNRLLPAINTKIYELNRIHFNIRNIDIWDYCVNTIWKNRKDLRIYEMVSDILNVDELELKKFLQAKDGD